MSMLHDAVMPRAERRANVPDLDQIDRHILALLCEDARISMRSLADRVGIGRSTAYARVERLRSLGVITGFTARLDPTRLGLAVTAHVVVTIEQHSWQEVLGAFRDLPEVAYCALLAAEIDVLLIVRAQDVATLRDVVLKRLNDVPHVRRTRTLLVLEDFATTDDHMLASLPDRQAAGDVT